MMLKEFLVQLQNEMDDIQADYGLASSAEKFAIWVGWKLFGLDPTRIANDSLLYVDNSKGVTVLGYLDEDSDKANIVTCWFRESKEETQIGVQQLRSLTDLWAAIQAHNLPLAAGAEEFLLELEDRGLSVDFSRYLALNVSLSSAAYEFAQARSVRLIDLGRLKDAYIRGVFAAGR